MRRSVLHLVGLISCLMAFVATISFVSGSWWTLGLALFVIVFAGAYIKELESQEQIRKLYKVWLFVITMLAIAIIGLCANVL